jgi:intracellular sulfur oxidation DsrE/DsrF family protein
MQAVDNLVQHYGEDAKIIVVANGPAVELFQKKLGKAQLMENLQVLNVEVGVCAVAMQQFDIPEDHVFPGVEVLKDTGIVRVMELQKKGYLYVKI